MVAEFVPFRVDVPQSVGTSMGASPSIVQMSECSHVRPVSTEHVKSVPKRMR